MTETNDIYICFLDGYRALSCQAARAREETLARPSSIPSGNLVWQSSTCWVLLEHYC